MLVLSVGDLHGRNNWESIDFKKYDKVIFVGDYTDSFDLGDKQIMTNLRNLVYAKKQYPDKIVLILGNHDIQYIMPNQICTGYRSSMYFRLNTFFLENIELFTMAYQIGYNLWTHAGITETFNNEVLRGMRNKRYRFFDIITEDCKNEADLINFLWEMRNIELFRISFHRGGASPYAGPIWTHDKELINDPIHGLNQIVGHTSRNEIEKIGINEEDFLYFIDVPNESNFLELVI